MTGADENVRPDSYAREARYAEAMHRATCGHRGGQPGTCPVDGGLAFYRWAEAVVAVADEERAGDAATIAELRAEVEDKWLDVKALAEQVADTRRRAEAAEERLRAVEAVARDAIRHVVSGHSHWDSTMQYGRGCTTCLGQYEQRDRLEAELAALAPPTSPAEQEGGPEWWDADHDRRADAYCPPERQYCRGCGVGRMLHGDRCTPLRRREPSRD